jgi:hypothetical protein
VAVTGNPTAAWTAQQLRNAFPEDQAPRYLLHDRDGSFAAAATTVAGMNIQTVRTAPCSPWQNAYVERVIGSIRRECLDHVIEANEAGLRRVLAGYIAYYMRSRTHLALAKDSPAPRPVQSTSAGRIVVTPEVGLLHRYDRVAAQHGCPFGYCRLVTPLILRRCWRQSWHRCGGQSAPPPWRCGVTV